MFFKFGFIFIISGVVFTSFYKLSESPVTWTDEGLIVQTSQNLVGQGVYGFQVGPNQLISPSFISTSYPVTFPIALSFYMFGINLLHARWVMALYIIFLVSLVFFLFRREVEEKIFWALLLVSSFPPLYGHGKNVLGEIPGVFFVLSSAFFLKRVEEEKNNTKNWVLFGIFFGLAVATKPIFILLTPALFFTLYRMYRIGGFLDYEKIFVLFISSSIPFIIWLLTQFFSTDSWISVIGYYSNPHSVEIIPAIIANIKDFITNSRTLFAGGTFLVWSIVLGLSLYKKRHVYIYESYLYVLSLFVFIFYFRNPPYYRYFFIAEFLSIIFLSFNLFSLSGKVWQKNIVRIFLCALCIFQFQQLYFDSWVASSFQSKKTRVMSEVIGDISDKEKVFFYQAPEAVIFLKHFNYYQYFSGTTATEFGEKNIYLIKDEKNIVVITRSDIFLKEPNLFSGYHIAKGFDRYVLLKK